MKKLKNNQGAVIIEFAMVISIFLIIAFVGFELSSCMKQRRLAMSLSKEIANAVYRECPDIIDRQGQEACLDSRVQQIIALSKIITDGVAIKVKIKWHESTGRNTARGCDSRLAIPCVPIDPNTGTTFGGYQFEADPPRFAGNVAGTGRGLDLMVISEVVVKYKPVITSVAQLFGLQNGGFFYAKSVL